MEPIFIILGSLIPFILIALVVLLAMSIRIINQYEKGVIFTLGKYSRIAEPGLRFIIPFIQTCTKVDMRERAVDVPSQEAMTKDNVSLTINAVLYFAIDDAMRSVVNVRALEYAIMQFALTTMRNIVGQFELDELLANKEEASRKIKDIVDIKSEAWGVDIKSVELKDLNIPDSLKRTMSKQAEAEREKRAKIIDAEGELMASEKLSQAAAVLSGTPGALHLRTLQSVNDISSDQSNTTIWMLPIEALRAIEGMGNMIHKMENKNK
ncbi:slipin family protein [Candidatus Gracilibacteria bacterium]|nr:slipin family protein [Candidatus Gracilibacteria bacterium]